MASAREQFEQLLTSLLPEDGPSVSAPPRAAGGATGGAKGKSTPWLVLLMGAAFVVLFLRKTPMPQARLEPGLPAPPSRATIPLSAGAGMKGAYPPPLRAPTIPLSAGPVRTSMHGVPLGVDSSQPRQPAVAPPAVAPPSVGQDPNFTPLSF